MSKLSNVVSVPTRLRCAIYTRKSNEEGLEQSFNSLHAQREACEAYVRSQTGEGWSILSQAYDDGGFSGGNIDRPGLVKLLADVDAGRIDIIVVYKVDRLTRSLMDFSRIVERFEARSVSFVSVTQAFNTTSSMGRLMLNVLLSFAQFEREVTGERIRDKIAASKARGMWMGGMLPLGYDVHERKLTVVDSEAELVGHIFRRYEELRSVPQLADELNQAGLVTKTWVSSRGNALGGARFWTGGLTYLLRNRLYIGEIVHRDTAHPGQHESIIDRGLFERVQAILTDNSRARRQRPTRAARSPLAGLVYDAEGVPMAPSFSYGRRKQIYRYYVSASILPGRGAPPESGDVIRRVPAATIEAIVVERVTTLMMRDAPIEWVTLTTILQRVEIRSRGIHILLRAEQFLEPGVRLHQVIRRLREVGKSGDTVMTDGDGAIRLICDVIPVFRGGRYQKRSEDVSPLTSTRTPNRVLAKTLRAAHKLLEQYRLSPLQPQSHHAATAPAGQRERRLMGFGLIAPDIQRAVLEGRGPPGLSAKRLLDADLPISWADQREIFGLAA